MNRRAGASIIVGVVMTICGSGLDSMHQFAQLARFFSL
jgi:hypothetical protein